MGERYSALNNFPLKQYNSMAIQAYADTVLIPFEASGVLELSFDYSFRDSIILGKGSNVIFAHERYDAPIILTDFLKKIYYQDESIISECGVSLSQLSWFALENSIPGFEFLEDIPGSVGGGLYMNAGTYEDCIGNMVQSVMIYDYNEGRSKVLAKDELSPFWKKRDSYFQHHPCFILQCSFRTSKPADYETILSKMLDLKKKRYLKQPRNFPSAGSVFKRPYINGEPKYIWQLFDAAGLRGYRIGDAQVSEKHPGFIINRGNATGKDIIDLMNHCKTVVKDQFGIQIEEEWKIV